jgi:hypothetical protein
VLRRRIAEASTDPTGLGGAGIACPVRRNVVGVIHRQISDGIFP